jgi:hypothetical protein
VHYSYDEEKIESSDDDSGSKKYKMRLWWGLWWGLVESAFGGSLETGGRFCVGAFGKNLASIAVKIFSHLIFLKNKCYINFVPSIRFAKIMLQ